MPMPNCAPAGSAARFSCHDADQVHGAAGHIWPLGRGASRRRIRSDTPGRARPWAEAGPDNPSSGPAFAFVDVARGRSPAVTTPLEPDLDGTKDSGCAV